MAEIDVSTLDQIFRMLTPVDILGNQKISLGKAADVGGDPVSELKRMLYNNGAGGGMTATDIKSAFLSQLTNVSDPEATKLFNRVFRMYSSTGPLKGTNVGTAQYEYTDQTGKLQPNVTFDQIIKGGTTFTMPQGKQMSVMLCNSEFLTPSVRGADKAEMFLNFMPTVVMSRCVPYLEVEFVFDRPDPAPLRSASLLKFLLGSPAQGTPDYAEATSATPATATGQMAALQTIIDPITGDKKSTVNMEIFTAPQTLINMSPVNQGSRYTAVLDPTRPMASLESFVVNVTPTVGLYSYKKANLVFKLHDRSRLAEIGDLIRPQIYTNTTAWVTYGWRHPDEPGNPYAEFINNNMLVREAYGIVNSQFAFDPLGQVGVTLELFTKGATELRTVRVPDSNPGALKAFQDIRDLAEKISQYKRSLNIGKPEGINKEIRAVQILESAEHGTFPDDLSVDQVQQSIAALQKSFNDQGNKIDTFAANNLIASLKKLYAKGNDQHFNFKGQIRQQATAIVQRKFAEVSGGADPFLMSAEKWNHYRAETGMDNVAHPYLKFIENYNQPKANTNINGVNNKLVSFGKLFTVFAGQLIMSVPCIDELQVYFHQFNDRAGTAAGTNIAEFPIDMPTFLDQYREHIERKGSERITLEEFLQLVIQAQVDDMRAVAYGFRSFYDPPFANAEAKLNSKKEGDFESAVSNVDGKGPFVKPVIEMYVETVFRSDNGRNVDLLKQFERRATSESATASAANSGRNGDLTRIMRIHVFDKTVNPYKLQAKLLRSDVGGNPSYYEVPSDIVNKSTPDQNRLLQLQFARGGAVALQDNGTVNVLLENGFSNDDVKRLVAKSMPTIVYGTNASSVINANLASKQDPLLAATQMLGNKSGRPSVNQPNGGGIGGMPLRIVPASMQMHTLGCPLLNFAQLFFVDFNTGTTADNLYGITGLTHTISPGKFETQLTFTYYDAYGRYENLPTLTDFIKQLEVPQSKGQ